ncbi:MAG: hypothetical protein WD176_03505, partial [Pirellulales bacterium]
EQTGALSEPMMPRRLCVIRIALVVSLAAAIVSGCGDKRGLVPVKGRVTFDGGRPPKPGRLSFGPTKTEGGFTNRPAQASFDADGKFEVASYKPGDGLTPGTYRVNVFCMEHDPQPVPGGLEAVTYVAPGYKGQEITVAAGSGPVELNIDVPLKKRK